MMNMYDNTNLPDYYYSREDQLQEILFLSLSYRLLVSSKDILILFQFICLNIASFIFVICETHNGRTFLFFSLLVNLQYFMIYISSRFKMQNYYRLQTDVIRKRVFLE
jgi:hypothetical protein